VLRLRQYGGFRSRVDLRNPFVHRLVGGLDALETIRAHVRYAIGDPFDVLLDRYRHIAEYRWAAGPRHSEHVREARYLQTEIVARAGRPRSSQRQAVAPANIHAQQRAGHSVEPRSEYDDVERILGIPRANAPRRDFLDRRGPDIDQFHVVTVERLEVVGIDRRALGRIRMIEVGQYGRRLGILHDLPDLRANEIRGRLVRCIVGQQIAKRSAESQTACRPGRFV
jgi:hypothetical protein